MPAYKTKYDIANLALAHLGREFIDSFSLQSDEATSIKNVYERAREAELMGDYWTFAIRRTISRPVGDDTLLWTPPDYAAATAYASAGLVVVDSNGDWWESKQATTGHTPDAASPYWQHYIGPDHMDPHVTDETYYTGELVKLSSAVYRCLTFGTTDTPPTSAWLSVAGTTADLDILWPIGAGPRQAEDTDNVYRLPHGWLRKAPIDPKAGINPTLGFYSNWMDDHVYEGAYFVSSDTGATVQRFVGDIDDVPLMSPMFCEMLGARIAQKVGPKLIEKGLPVILQNVDKHYKQERYKAVAVNAIITEAQTPTDDDYITCRF